MLRGVTAIISVFQCKPSGRFWNVTLERLSRLEQVMLDEIRELGKLVNGE